MKKLILMVLLITSFNTYADLLDVFSKKTEQLSCARLLESYLFTLNTADWKKYDSMWCLKELVKKRDLGVSTISQCKNEIPKDGIQHLQNTVDALNEVIDRNEKNFLSMAVNKLSALDALAEDIVSLSLRKTKTPID